MLILPEEELTKLVLNNEHLIIEYLAISEAKLKNMEQSNQEGFYAEFKQIIERMNFVEDLGRIGSEHKGQPLIAALGDEFELNGQIATAQTLNNQSLLAMGWNRLGKLLQQQGKLDQAQQAFEREIAIAEALNNQSLLAMGLNHLGEVLQQQGKLDQAQQAFERALEIDTVNKFSSLYTGLSRLSTVLEKHIFDFSKDYLERIKRRLMAILQASALASEQNELPDAAKNYLMDIRNTARVILWQIDNYQLSHQKYPVTNLLDWLKTSPTWAGDDFQECLDYVNRVRE
ncbi:tetratricopeptide repeat protein [Moorena sp. SIO3I6]|uniref:tetratricopeptide repeat protein n=1 Tax=Moorena sp. SIO3I6 TaxID=2607831 RepID=UPI0013F6A3AB|nr:tetratricopeptide repeat protein [Moorena sp. SIO3I6]NEP26124.1 tetratricopeptide repeat protein [Moorena sp. SIO3I6]